MNEYAELKALAENANDNEMQAIKADIELYERNLMENE